VGYNGSASSALVTYSSADDAARALCSSEAVLGRHHVQLQPLSADDASAAGISKVSLQCSES